MFQEIVEIAGERSGARAYYLRQLHTSDVAAELSEKFEGGRVATQRDENTDSAKVRAAATFKPAQPIVLE